MPVNKVKRRGSYAPLSAHYYKDDKVIRAGEKAELLYVRGLAFCADVLNDGFISDAQLAHVGVGLSNVKARAKALAETGAWERAAGGYYVKAWLRWNKSREDILDEAKRDADRKGSQGPDQPLPPEPPPGDEPSSDPYMLPLSDGIPNGNQSESNGNKAPVRTGSHARGSARAPSSSISSSTPDQEKNPSPDADASHADSDEGPNRDDPGYREDADALCALLERLIIANENKPPKVTNRWRQQARLLIDDDKRDYDQARRLIEWSQQDRFWRINILSMPTFRTQYDKLRLKAIDDPRWRIAAPHGQRDELTPAEVKAILQRGHRDVESPPREIRDDPEARSAWFKRQYDERLAQDRADAEHLLETSEHARSILAKLRRSS